MSWYHPSTLLDKIFEGGIILKGISGILEFLGGLLLVFIDPATIHRFLTFVTQREIQEDPHDKFANALLHSAQHLNAGSKTFAIAYLWVHAAVKLIAVFGLLRNKLWAYPFALITLGLLMLYQVYSIIVQASIGMTLLTIFDVFILWLIWREYGKARLLLGSQPIGSSTER
jgi:uncharacterized membrane protein